MGRRTSALLTAGVLGVGLLAACGSDEPADDPTEEQPAAPEDMTDGTEITTAESDLGIILVDGEGMTLYLFSNDSPGTSACTDDCLDAWPIVEGEPAAGEGVDEALLGTIERDDGTVQASYGDWPLYYFAQDTAAGDVTGQGLNEVWWVVAPDGEMVTEAPAAAPRVGY